MLYEGEPNLVLAAEGQYLGDGWCLVVANHATRERVSAWAEGVDAPVVVAAAGQTGTVDVVAFRTTVDDRPGAGYTDPRAAVLHATGLAKPSPEPWQLLGGCTGPGLISADTYAGEYPITDDIVRYVAGDLAPDRFGLWDRDHPEAPLETYPKNMDGYNRAHERLFELVQKPLLDRSILTGDVRYALIEPQPIERPAVGMLVRCENGSGALYWIVEGMAGPSTMTTFRPYRAARIMVQVPLATPIDGWNYSSVPKDFYPSDIGEACAAADQILADSRITSWTEPETADRSLLGLTAFIQQRADSHAASRLDTGPPPTS